jgi:prepilin-type N-terminal cleavage/methylation domain-containing protein
LTLPDRRRGARAGFTLAEVAVTLVIVGITLLWVLEGLNRAKMTTAHTHNAKIAAELATYTLGEIEAGLYWEEIDEKGLDGNYAEEGYETFWWEVVVGDETFPDMEGDEPLLEHDSLRERERRAERQREENDEDEEDIEEVYEKVRIRVVFPQFTELEAQVVLERWIPWEQVYGPSEEDEDAEVQEKPK